MYDIKNLRIWKETEKDNPLLSKKTLIEIDAFTVEVIMKNEYSRIKETFERYLVGVNSGRRGSSLKFNIYLTTKLSDTDIEVLDLSVRSYNCLKRAGIGTIGDLCGRIHSSTDLKAIRNCGNTSVSEIMDKLFYYHLMQLPEDKRDAYIKEVISLNDRT